MLVVMELNGNPVSRLACTGCPRDPAGYITSIYNRIMHRTGLPAHIKRVEDAHIQEWGAAFRFTFSDERRNRYCPTITTGREHEPVTVRIQAEPYFIELFRERLDMAMKRAASTSW